METFFFDWWWRSHQSLAREGLCIFGFCVMPWKDESEPNIKFCLGTTVGLVQRLITIQNFGKNWRRSDGIRVEYFPGFTTLQLCNKVREFMSKMSDPSEFKGRIIFMSMFNDISWRSEDNEQECELSASLVSTFARRFLLGRWSSFGPGSEKKWYCTHVDRPEGKWDRVAELMMIKFAESGHPVFRAASPMSRGRLKSKGLGTLSIQWRQSARRMGHNGREDDDHIHSKWTSSLPSHEPIVQGSSQKQRRWKNVHKLLCRFGNDWDFSSPNCFCKSAQSLRCSRRNVWRIWILSRGKTRCVRTVEFLIRAECDQHKRAFEHWLS